MSYLDPAAQSEEDEDAIPETPAPAPAPEAAPPTEASLPPTEALPPEALPIEEEAPTSETLDFQSWTARQTGDGSSEMEKQFAADPVAKYRAYSGYVRQSLLENGEWDDDVISSVDERLASLAVEAGDYTPADPEAGATIADVLRKPKSDELPLDSLLSHVSAQNDEESITRRDSVARLIALKQNPDLATPETLAGAEAEVRGWANPEMIADAENDQVLKGRKLAALVPPPVEGGAQDVAISKELYNYVRPDGSVDDRALGKALKFNNVDPELIPAIRQKLSTPAGYEASLDTIQRHGDFMSSLESVAKTRDRFGGFEIDHVMKVMARNVETGNADYIARKGVPKLNEILKDQAFWKNATEEERVAFTTDYLKSNEVPEIDPENPAAALRKLSTGEYVAPLPLMLDEKSFEKAIGSVPKEQQGRMRQIASMSVEANAKNVIKVFSENPQGGAKFVSFMQDQRESGKKDGEIVKEWVAKGEFSAAGALGMGTAASLKDAVLPFVALLSPDGTAVNEFAMKAMVDSQKADSNRREYAKLFGYEHGIGYDLSRLVAPVAIDLLVTRGASTAAVAIGRTAARATIAEGFKAFVGTAVRAEGKSMVKNWAMRSAASGAEGVGVKLTAQHSVDDVINFVGRDIMQSAYKKTAFAGTMVTSYNRSAQSTYASLSTALASETNPDGSAKYSASEVKEIAMNHSIAAGAITMAVVGGFQLMGREGVESVLNRGLSKSQLQKVYTRLSKDIGSTAKIGDDVIDMTSADTMLRSMIKQSVTPFFKSAGVKGAFDEGLEEGVESIFQAANTAMATEGTLNIKDTIKQAIYEGALGGIMGGSMSGVAAGFKNQSRPDVATEADIRRTKLQEIATKLDATSPQTAQVLRNAAANQRRLFPEQVKLEAEFAKAKGDQKASIQSQLEQLRNNAAQDPRQRLAPAQENIPQTQAAGGAIPPSSDASMANSGAGVPPADAAAAPAPAVAPTYEVGQTILHEGKERVIARVEMHPSANKPVVSFTEDPQKYVFPEAPAPQAADAAAAPAPAVAPTPAPTPQPVVNTGRARMAEKILTAKGIDPETANQIAEEFATRAGEGATTEDFREKVLTEFRDAGGVIPEEGRSYSENPDTYAGAGDTDAEATAARSAEANAESAAAARSSNAALASKLGAAKAAAAPQVAPTRQAVQAAASAALGTAPTPAPSGRGAGVTAVFAGMSDASQIAFRQRGRDTLANGERITFTKPESIEAAKTNPYYTTKDNGDGTVDVVDIAPEGSIAEAPAPQQSLPEMRDLLEAEIDAAERNAILDDITEEQAEAFVDRVAALRGILRDTEAVIQAEGKAAEARALDPEGKVYPSADPADVIAIAEARGITPMAVLGLDSSPLSDVFFEMPEDYPLTREEAALLSTALVMPGGLGVVMFVNPKVADLVRGYLNGLGVETEGMSVKDMAVAKDELLADPTLKALRGDDTPSPQMPTTNAKTLAGLAKFDFAKGLPTFLKSVIKKSKDYGQVAQLLELVGAGNVVVKLVSMPNTNVAGFFIPSNGTVVINTAMAGPRGVEDTILHELLHAVTESALQNPTPEQASAIKRIDRLRNSVIKKAKQNGTYAANAYALSHNSEFLTHFFTSDVFRNTIEGMTPKGEMSWTEVLSNLITELLAKAAGFSAAQMTDLQRDLFSLIQTPRIGLSPSAGVVSQPAETSTPELDNELNKYITGNWPADEAGRYAELRTFAERWVERYGQLASVVEFRVGDKPFAAGYSDSEGYFVRLAADEIRKLSRTSQDEESGKRTLAIAISEEFLHVAQYRALAKSLAPQEVTEANLLAEVKRIYGELEIAAQSNPEISKTLLASAAVYRRDDISSEMLTEAEPSDGLMYAGNNKIRLVNEMTRQIVQMRRMGSTTEVELNQSMEYLKGLTDIVRQADQTGVLEETFNTNVGNTEDELDSRGIRFQPAQDVARFAELVTDLPHKPTQAQIDEWKEANPSKYAELKEMREEVLRAAGYDLEGSHGTTHSFNEFLRSKANPDNNLGAGFYLSSSEDDVSVNYANVDGPDLTNRIERLAEQLEGEGDVTRNQALKKARKALVGKEVRTINALIRFENPVILDGNGNGRRGTEIELMPDAESYRAEAIEQIRDENSDDFDEDTYEDEITDRMYELQSNDMAAESVLQKIGYAIDNFNDTDSGTVLNKLHDEGESIQAYRLEELLRNSDGVGFATDDSGERAADEVIRSVFEALGYDGIIDKNVYAKFGRKGRMDGVYYGTTHYIAFDSSQIKSTEPLNLDDDGKLITPDKWGNVESSDIRFQPAETSLPTEEQFNEQIKQRLTGNWKPEQRAGEIKSFVSDFISRNAEAMARLGWRIESVSETGSRDTAGRGGQDDSFFARATILEGGLRVIQIQENILGDTATSIVSEFDAKKYVAKVLEEEILHAAHFNFFEANGVIPEGVDPLEAFTAHNARVFADMVDTLIKSGNDDVVKSVADSLSVYRATPMSVEDLASSYTSGDHGATGTAIAEMARQITQLRRTGGITESAAVSALGNPETLAWAAERMSSIREVAGDLSLTSDALRNNVEGVEAVLSKSDIRFQPSEDGGYTAEEAARALGSFKTPMQVLESMIPARRTTESLGIDVDNLMAEAEPLDYKAQGKYIQAEVDRAEAKYTGRALFREDANLADLDTAFELTARGRFEGVHIRPFRANRNLRMKLMGYLSESIRSLHGKTKDNVATQVLETRLIDTLSAARVGFHNDINTHRAYGQGELNLQPSEPITEDTFDDEVRKYITENWPADTAGREAEGRTFVAGWLSRYAALLKNERINVTSDFRGDSGGLNGVTGGVIQSGSQGGVDTSTFRGDSGELGDDSRGDSGGDKSSSAAVLEDGSISVTLAGDIFKMAGSSEIEAKTYIARAIQEEVIHAVHLRAIAARLDGAENIQEAVVSDLQDTYENMLESGDFLQKLRDISTSAAVYSKNPKITPEIISNVGPAQFAGLSDQDRVAIIAELARQAVQLRRSEGITEQASDWWKTITDWFNERLNVLRRIAAAPESMGSSVARDIQDIEALMDASGIRFQPADTSPSVEHVLNRPSRLSGFMRMFFGDKGVLASADSDPHSRAWVEKLNEMFIKTYGKLANSATKSKQNRESLNTTIEETVARLSKKLTNAIKSENADAHLVQLAAGNIDPLISAAVEKDIIRAYDEEILNAEIRIDNEAVGMKNADEMKAALMEVAVAEAERNRNVRIWEERDRAAEARREEQMSALAELERSSPDTYEAIIDLRAFTNDLQRMAKEVNKGNPQIQAIIDQSMSVYLVRSFAVHQDPKQVDRMLNSQDPEYVNRRAALIGFFETKAKADIMNELESDPEFLATFKGEYDYAKITERMETLANERAEKRALEMFNDFMVGRESEKGLFGAGSDVANEINRYMKKMNMPQEFLDALMVNTDPVFNLANTSMSLGRLIVNANMLSEVAASGIESGRYISKAEKESGVTYADGKKLLREVLAAEGNEDVKAELRGKLFSSLYGGIKAQYRQGLIQEMPTNEVVLEKLDAALTEFGKSNKSLFELLPELGRKSDRIVTDLFISSKKLSMSVKDRMAPMKGKYASWKPIVSENEGNSAFAPLGGLFASPEQVEAFQATFHTSSKVAEHLSQKALALGNKYLIRAAGASLGVATLGSPAYFVRNLFGGLFYTSMNGVNFADPKLLSAAGDFIKQTLMPNGGISPEFQELIAGRVAMDGAQIGYLKQLIESMGDTTTLERLGEIAGTADQKMGAVAKGSKQAVKAAFTKLQAFAEITEVYPAVMTYVDFKMKLTEAGFGTEREIQQEASRLTKMVMPSKSEASSAVNAFTGSGVGALFGAFIRFKAEVIRNTINSAKLAREWSKSENPVLRKYGQRKMVAFATVAGLITVLMPIIAQRLLQGIDDEEDEAIRSSLPSYLRNSSLYYKLSPDGVQVYNLTFTNPYSFSLDPISRSLNALIAREPEEIPGIVGHFLTEDMLGENIVASKAMDARRNVDSSTGRQIYLEADSDVTQYVKTAGHIGRAYWPRLFTQAGRFADAVSRDTTGADLFDTPLGVAVATVAPFKPTFKSFDDMERNSLSNVRRKKSELSAITSPVLSPKPLSPEEAVELRTERSDMNMKIAKETLSLVDGFKKLRQNGAGVGDSQALREIMRNAEDAGLSRDRFKRLVERRTVERLVFPDESMRRLKEIDTKRYEAIRRAVSSEPRNIPVE